MQFLVSRTSSSLPSPRHSPAKVSGKWGVVLVLTLACLSHSGGIEAQSPPTPDPAKNPKVNEDKGDEEKSNEDKPGGKPATPLPSTVGAIRLPVPAEELSEIFAGKAPRSLEELTAMEAHVKALTAGLVKATVGVRVRGAQGSGVIISADGYVLTAGHVSTDAGRTATLILHDGREVRAKTLGANRGIDSGLMKITEPGPYPFVTMGASSDLERGQWCLATGHPGGYEVGRSAPLRLGRITRDSRRAIVTDCILVGGDSGGPLFDMRGRVIGIHSRITASSAGNVHVPIDTYRDTWKRLAESEVWGSGIGTGRQRRDDPSPFLGVQAEEDSKDARIARVVPGTPAFKAGIERGDVIIRFDGAKVGSFESLVTMIRKKKVGDTVKVVVMRDDKEVDLSLTLERRGRR